MKCGEDPSLSATSRTCGAQDSGEDVKLYQDLFEKPVKFILGCNKVSSRKSEDLQHKEAQVLLTHIQRWKTCASRRVYSVT
jgi:hypothetical protein